MELRRVRCTQCGADFDRFDPTVRMMRCNRMGCGAVFVVEQGVKFAEVDNKAADEIGKLRKAMENAIAAHNQELIFRHATSVQEMLPDDYTANFWLSLLSVRLYDKHPAIYEDFLRSDCAATDEEVEKCAQYAIENATEDEADALREFFETRFSKDAVKTKMALLRARLFRLRELNKKSGDVFILSDRSGGEIADELYRRLRQNGVSCWSERQNLSRETTGYRARIREACEGCRAMLVVANASIAANSSCKNLIADAKKKNVPLIVLKCGNEEFAHSFDCLITDANVLRYDDETASDLVICAVKNALNPPSASDACKSVKTEELRSAVSEIAPSDTGLFDRDPFLKPLADDFDVPPSFDEIRSFFAKEESTPSEPKMRPSGLIFKGMEENELDALPSFADLENSFSSGLISKDAEDDAPEAPRDFSEMDDPYALPPLIDF